MKIQSALSNLAQVWRLAPMHYSNKSIIKNEQYKSNGLSTGQETSAGKDNYLEIGAATISYIWFAL
jgi:hypothetical protein